VLRHAPILGLDLPGYGSVSRPGVIAALQRHFDSGAFLDDLAGLVAFRTESQVPERMGDLYAYLSRAMAPWLERLGYTVALFDNPVAGGGPFLVGRRMEEGADLTVLTYGHGDVVRGMEADWHADLDPWTLTRRGERIYGRGVADNKGQHAVALAALEQVIAARGRLGFNSVVFIETSEEIGSPGIHDFAAAQRDILAADVLIASDGPRVAHDLPTLFMGSRGAMNLELVVALRDAAHHSGNWGGVLADPGILLAHAIASIMSPTGEILVPELKPARVPQGVRRALADITVEGGEEGPQIDAWWGEPGLTAAEKVFGWNSFDVLAFVTGNPDDPVNAVPPQAFAHCQVRFTVDTDPDGFVAALRRHLDAAGLAMVQVREAPGRARWAATRLDPDNPWVDWAARSIARTTGSPPAILPNLGGSLPNDVFADTLAMPTIWIPHSYAGCSQHAPNEHGLAALFGQALEIMGGIFWDLGEDTPRPQNLSRRI
jgi:acetylornithine deacetylase/succinyl-diaminopimelate desuccinylase-like protein